MNKNGKSPPNALRVLASVWAHSGASTINNARTLAALASTSKKYKKLIGSPSILKAIRERKNRIKSILRRRRFLIEKMRLRRTPLTHEEREFLNFFDIARWRGEGYLKNLVPSGLRRQQASLMFTRLPLYYNYNIPMRIVRPTSRQIINGTPRFNVTPVIVNITNRYRTTGKSVHKFPGASNKWKRAVQKAFQQRKLFVR